MSGEPILIVDDSAEVRAWLIESVMRPAGYAAAEAPGLSEARAQIAVSRPHAIVLAAQLGAEDGLSLLRQYAPTIPIVVTTPHRSLDEVQAALGAGAHDVLVRPFEPERLATSIARALRSTQAVREREALREQTERQLQEFNALYSIGKTITALLDVDEILAQVVSAATYLTGADEGSLLLLDPDTGELYLRANQNLDESITHHLRVKVEDSLMGRVIQTGRPVMLSAADEVKTSLPVKAILNVPMIVAHRVIGVLSVDHKRANRVFSEHDVHLLSTLADYAAIAIENARLYWAAEGERAKLHTILRDTQDAVIVTDPDLRIVLVNNAARAAFRVGDEAIGEPLAEVIHHPALLDLFDQHKLRGHTWRAEIVLEDGRILQGQLSEFSGIGFGAVMQDISRLKEIDRIKSEFISIVSHDLRTPLTTVRGYVELLSRVGPLTAQQEEFVERIRRSTTHIIDLTTDLLDVGRIEAGFDWEMRSVALHSVVLRAIQPFQITAAQNNQTLTIDVPERAPIFGSARRLEQVVANLVSNAIKYTPAGGHIVVALNENNDYLMLQVRDTGIGISAEDQPRIFDKFYRVESEQTIGIGGTGLGLSIVKTIVERHQGRVWVDSEPGKGSTFTVLLPKYTP